MKPKENLPLYSSIEINAATKFVEAIDPSQLWNLSPDIIKNTELGSDFTPASTNNHRYVETTFHQVSFTGLNANNSILKNCDLNQCKVISTNLKHSDFSGSKLNFDCSSSSFDLSDFSGSTIYDSNIMGCSFSESYFYNAQLQRTQFVHSEFVAAVFEKVNLMDLDLTQTSLEYAEFSKVAFSNVTLPYWNILHVTKGLSDILDEADVWFETPDRRHRVGLKQYIEEIRLLVPYFYGTNDFLALVNLYLFEGEHGKAYDALLTGLQNAGRCGNLKLIKNLCRIASLNHFFSRDQLRALYQLLENQISTSTLSYMKYKNYLLELDAAKRLLVDRPFNQDAMSITVQTTIPNDNYHKLTSAVQLIDTMIEENAPNVSSHIEIRHNSPIEIVIQISGALGKLILVFALLEAVFDKSTTYIERIQNIVINHRKIHINSKENSKLESLEAQVHEIKETVQTWEQSYLKSGSAILIPGSADFQRISYTLSAGQAIPDELLTFSIMKSASGK